MAQRQMTWHEVAAELGRAQARIAELEGQAAVLVEALTTILEEPYGCPFCDSGKLRNPSNPEKGHEDTCGYLRGSVALASLPAAIQQHLARDRAAGMALGASPWCVGADGRSRCHWCQAVWSEMGNHRSSCEWAAYRAAGGERG